MTGSAGKEVFSTSLPEWFRPLYIGSSMWQTMGFNAIIFIAAGRYQPGLRGGNWDGATRFQRILRIDIHVDSAGDHSGC